MDTSQEDCVVLLMCVATGGHHSIASYQWSKNRCDLLGEFHAVLKDGKYTCSVINNKKSAKRLSEVTGTRSSNVNAILIH